MKVNVAPWYSDEKIGSFLIKFVPIFEYIYDFLAVLNVFKFVIRPVNIYHNVTHGPLLANGAQE